MGSPTSRYTNFRRAVGRTLKGKRNKGQWYIVAAVLFSYSLLTFFYIFDSYSQIDYTTLIKCDEDTLFLDALEDLNEITLEGGTIENVEGDIAEYLYMVNGNLLGSGIYVNYDFSQSDDRVNLSYLEISGENLRVNLPVASLYCVDECDSSGEWYCDGEVNQSCGYYDVDGCLDYREDDCSDCSCYCGHYGLEDESGYCFDGKDNDCDGDTDTDDSDCSGVYCEDASDCLQDDCVIETCNSSGMCEYESRSQCASDECSGQSMCDSDGGDCTDPDSDSTVCSSCYSGDWDPVTDKCCGDDGPTDEWCNSGGGACVNGSWHSDHCADGVQNCDETGIDCGGSECGTCYDCTPGTCDLSGRRYCDAGYWTGADSTLYCNNCAHCTDGTQNCGELGPDCGGGGCAICWLTGWTYRRPITLSNSGSALTGYQEPITVSYSSHMQSDFDDIRFTTADGYTEIDYWRESYTGGGSGSFYVEVPSLPAGSSTIYMYYGNSGVSTTSNGRNTLLVYDFMSVAPMGSMSGRATYISPSYVQLTNAATGSPGYLYYTVNPGNGFHSKFKFWAGGGNGADSVWLGAYDTTLSGTTEDIVKGGYHFTFDEYQTRICFTKSTSDNGGGIRCVSQSGTDNGVWHQAEVYFWKDGSGAHAKIYYDGTLKVNSVDSSPQSLSGNYVYFGARTGASYNEHRVDDAWIRKYASPEPTYSMGPEQTQT